VALINSNFGSFSLPDLPRLDSLLLPGVGGPGIGGGITLPGVIIPPGLGKPEPDKNIATTPDGVLGGAFSVLSCLFAPNGSCLLRLVFLILGLICIIGAIYLFKPVNEIVGPPVRAAVKSAIA
jgi:hypothetical protein